MTTTLEYVLLGHTTDHDQQQHTLDLIAYSEDVPSQEVAFYRNLVELEPMPIDDELQSQSMAMVDYQQESMVLARSHYQQGSRDRPVYQYIFIPYDTLLGIGGRITPFQSLLRTPISTSQSHHMIVSPMRLPTVATGKLNVRVTQIEQLLNNLLNDRFELAMTLLGAIIHERRLMIRNFPLDLDQRLDLVQGLRMLLPSAAAMRMSFATYCKSIAEHTPLLVFTDNLDDTERWQFDWNEPQAISAVIDHPYIELLQSLWKRDINDFVFDIKPMDIISLRFINDDNFVDNLSHLTDRFRLDQQVRDNQSVETSAMVQVLESNAAPQGRLRYQYIEKLLQNALNNRDTDAGKVVAQELNRDENLEQSLSGVFDEMLDTQPDTVYVFIRNRLNNFGVDERWLPRLKVAATNSLEVAIEEGDISTLTSWLELIAREPQAYELEEVLKQGIKEAQPRAYEDGELGIRLILIAARRTPEILGSLYQDDELMGALPNDVGTALRYKTAVSLNALTDNKPEHFLLALSHALQTSDEQVVTARSVQKLWALYESNDKFNLPQMYQPLSLIRMMGTQYSYQMTDDAIDSLLSVIVEANDNDLFVEVATHLANSDNLFPRLGRILRTNNQSYDQALTLMNWVSDIKNVSPKNVVDTYLELLDYWGWDASTQQMIESVGRSLIQNPTLVVFPRHLWKLFEASNALKLESTTRVAMTRLLQQFSQDNNQESIVSEIDRIYRQILWSKPLQATFNTWWREYTQTCSFGQLQRLDKDLEGHRILEPQQEILQTAVAMRRLLGNRDLVDFAEAVNTTFSILESITDAFDKGQLTELDSETIRNELDALSGDLPLDARHILAKNLRELAQYITQMADKRSKPSLMKSDEVIERQLLQGETNPQGSIDVMKWMAGYLGGTHNIDEDE